MSEIAPAGGGPNRLFLVLAIGLAGLLVIGLLAVVGLLVVPRLVSSNVAPTPTVHVAAVNTPVPTTRPATPTLAPTSAPTEAPTPTLVLASGGGTAQTLATPTASGAGTTTPTVIGGSGTTTPVGTGTPGGALPQSGLGEDLMLLAGGVVLVFIIFAARRARAA